MICSKSLVFFMLHMPLRLMCLLFRDDLTVTENIPLCSLPTHTPQESDFQETTSDRSADREAEDGRLSGMEKNRRFLLSFLLLFYRKLEKGPNCGSSFPPWFLPFIVFSIGKNIIITKEFPVFCIVF